jgi:hypothetical protein
MDKQILIKAVRIRGDRIPKVQGGRDGILEVYKIGKDIALVVLALDNTLYPGFTRIRYPNGTLEDLNTLISRYLSSSEASDFRIIQSNFKVIQDPFNPSVTPFQNVPPSPPPVEPKPTPEKVEEKRLQTASDDQVVLDQQDAETIDAKQIENATPADLKAMGIAKLPLLLLVIGNQVKKIINPALRNLIDTYIKKFLDANACPDEATIEKIIRIRNLIVSQLNKIGKIINIITISLTGVATFLSLLQGAIKAIDIAKIAAKAAAVAFPPLAPALPTVINTLSQAKTTAIIDDKGNSRLQKLISIIGGAALVASIIGGFILVAVILLNSIDAFIQKCSPSIPNQNTPNTNNKLIPISKEIQDIAELQAKSTQAQNETTYKGFNIIIEEVPYTPTVIRRRALGQNQDGITLIQTELSFTTDDQTLINELKLIIDRDNLEAY